MKRMLNTAALGLGGARARRSMAAKHQANVIENVKEMINRDLKLVDVQKLQVK